MNLEQILNELLKHYDKHGLEASCPEGEVVAAIQELEDAKASQNNFNLEEWIYDQKQGDEEALADFRAGR